MPVQKTKALPSKPWNLSLSKWFQVVWRAIESPSMGLPRIRDTAASSRLSPKMECHRTVLTGFYTDGSYRTVFLQKGVHMTCAKGRHQCCSRPLSGCQDQSALPLGTSRGGCQSRCFFVALCATEIDVEHPSIGVREHHSIASIRARGLSKLTWSRQIRCHT
ncbi:hypothetical protein BJY00DRAFT_106137 [Aspergillus carlsbadensis]|nr:hypothetical protein BJY00DRAFT_106137 [Aspergillus carlsbadensis]